MKRHPSPRLLWVLAACACFLIPARPAPGATVQEVNDAVKKGVKFLYDIQDKASGSWEVAPQRDEAGVGHSVTGGQWGGLTAMATYALLAAGENPQNPQLDKAIKWLTEKNLVGTYAVGLRAQVWTFLPTNHPHRSAIKKALRADRDFLLTAMYSEPSEKQFGFYTYTYDGNKKSQSPPGHYDRSNSQYGVLGMWAVAQAGEEVPLAYWKTQDAVWKKSQNVDGGWEYTGENATTANMAAAGLATLFITQDYLLDPRGLCKGNYFSQEIEMGLAWMDKNVGQLLAGENYYGMYGVERIGVASGRKYFGKTNWYAVGAETIVRKQGGDGAWGADEGVHNPKKIPSTCFSLFFLTRGRAPVIMNKLEWTSVAKEGKEVGWHQRHRDLANFSRWMGKNLDGRFINWQIVNLKGNIDDLHDSPILYIAGTEPVAFSKEDTAKLKKFVEDGGLILANADCGSKQAGRFIKGIKTLAKDIYPMSEFRALPSNHPIYTNQQFNANKWKKKPVVEGLSNGVRELMLLIPDADPAKAWQSYNTNHEELFQLGANISLYSNGGQNLRYRGETHLVKDLGKAPGKSINVARIQYKGVYDPEPGGWRRLATVMKNEDLATLSGYDKPVELGKGQLKGFQVAHMTGVSKFKLSDAERKELKAFVNGGGTLVIDAAGGSADFADAAEAELIEIFGDTAKKQLDGKPLPKDHELYNLAGAKIENFSYRAFARKKVGRLKDPRIKAINLKGRPAVFFSREDLSGGLVGQAVDGIIGYDPDTATNIMRNILLYSAGGAKAAPVAAKPPEAAAAPIEEVAPQ